MAQVKKLQSGGASPSTTQIIPKKRMYNGVELTDADLDRIVNDTAEFISKNSNYSEDVRGISDLSNKIKEELKRGNMPEFDPTGTGLKIGNIIINAGKHNQNIFGNFSGDKLGREFAFRLKEGFDSYTRPSENTQTTVSTTPTQKYHNDLSKTISDRYFGGNWENAQKGIGELTSDKRLSYVKQGLKDSILKYKEVYGEDSKYSNRLSEIDAATPERIKEIAYEMGMDATDFLEGTAEQREAAKAKTAANNRYLELEQQYGTKINDDFLASKGLVAFRNKDNITNLFNDSDLSQYVGDNIIENKFGNNYGWGIFKSPTKGWYFGTKNDLEKIPEINQIVSGTYAAKQNEYRTARNKLFDNGLYTVDFNKESSRFFQDPLFNQYRDGNKFQFYDYTNSFSNVNPNSRVVIPNKGIVEDILGGLDIENNTAFIVGGGKPRPVKINIDRITNKAIATAQDGTNEIIDLGIFGDSFNVNNRNPNAFDYKFSKVIADGLNYDDVINEELTLLDSTGKNTGQPINKNNIIQYVTNILDGKYNAVNDKEVIKLAKITKKYLDKYPQNWSKVTIKKLNDKLIGMVNEPAKHIKGTYSTSNKTKQSSNKTKQSSNKALEFADKLESWGFKKGGTLPNKIIKAQVGATLRKLQDSQNVKPLVHNTTEIKNTIIKPEYGDLKLKDIGKKDLSVSDTADIASTGLDALSLAGGALGVLAGVASTAVQGYGDYKRGGFNKDFVNNLAMNLGFTALALVPGLSAAKFAKGAVKATELLKDAEKAEKLVMKAAKYSKNAEKVAEAELKLKSIKKAQEVVKNKNVIATALNNKLVKGAANTARAGFTVTGAINAGSSAANIWEETNGLENAGNIRVSDIRGLLGGVGAYKSAKGYADNYLVKRGTTRTVSDVELPRTVKVKETGEKIEVGKYDNSNVNQKIRDVYKQKALKKLSELEDLKAKKVDGVENKDLDIKIKALEDEHIKLSELSTKATYDKSWKDKASNTSKDLKEKGKNWLNKNTNDWDGRTLKNYDKNASWIDKLAHKKARQAGFEKDGYQMTYEEVMSKLYPGTLMDLQKGTSINKAYSKIKGERADIAKSNRAVDEIEAMFKFRDLKVKGLKRNKRITKPFGPRKLYNSPNINVNKIETKLPPLSQILGNPFKLPQRYAPAFKQGGRLIPKFQKSGQLNWTLQNNDEKNYFKQTTYLDKLFQTQNSNLKNRLEKVWNPNSPIYKSGELTETISGEQIKTPIYNTKFRGNPGNPTSEITYTGKDLPEVTASKGGDKKTEYTPYNKKTLSVNPTQLLEFTKLADAIGTNRKVSQKLRSVSPVMLQTTSEIYKPVVTNLANENFVNNQVNSYLHQASRPMTSDASLQKGMQLEALSKITPMTIQAKAANTDMYNQTLGASRDSAEKYAAMRTEIANANRERIGANEARIAQIGATELAVNKESRNAFTDEMIKNYKEKSMRDFQVKNQLELNRLSTEFNNKLKPYSTRYNELLNDPKTSSVYQRAKTWQEFNKGKRIEDYTENGKTYNELLSLEQSNAQKAYETESEKLKPYYETAMINLRGGDPYNRTYSFGTYKKGGTIDAKVEIQNLKNKMKAKEINAKSDDKAKDRNERAVAAILKSMSKESLFLLKTMLGK